MVTQGLAKPSARNGVQVQVLLAPPILNSAGLRSPALFSFQNRLFCYCVGESKGGFSMPSYCADCGKQLSHPRSKRCSECDNKRLNSGHGVRK